MEFAFEKLADECDKPKENVEFILINTLTYALTELVTDVLLYYGECSNIPEEFRPRFNMKNEFLKISLRTINLFNCWKLSLGYQYSKV